MKAECGAGGEFDFAEGEVVFQDIDRAELIEVEAGVGGEHGLEEFGANVDVFRSDERADGGAVVALLDFVPPAVDLVADHGGFFDEEGAAGEEL